MRLCLDCYDCFMLDCRRDFLTARLARLRRHFWLSRDVFQVGVTLLHCIVTVASALGPKGRDDCGGGLCDCIR